MCGRYDLMDEKDSGKMHAFIEMCNRTALPEEKIDETDFGEICPGDLAPGMICADGMIHAVSKRWGFVEKDRKLVINARCESVLERAMFRHLAESHRCAMPAAAVPIAVFCSLTVPLPVPIHWPPPMPFPSGAKMPTSI